jgi:hypothetical protein
MFASLIRDRNGTTGAEFALVVPLLVLVMFTVIDGGRFMWEMNLAEKATQAGARYAVVTNPVPSGLTTATFLAFNGLKQGDRIPASALPAITCDNSACTPNPCDSCPTGIPGTYDGTAFTAIVGRMHYYDPAITAANVTVEYRGSGLGFAGDPNPPEVAPLVTIRLTGMTFQPLSSFLFGQITMPSFSTTLTAEDLSGTQAN